MTEFRSDDDDSPPTHRPMAKRGGEYRVSIWLGDEFYSVRRTVFWAAAAYIENRTDYDTPLDAPEGAWRRALNEAENGYRDEVNDE